MRKVHTIIYKVLIISSAVLMLAGCSPSSWEDDMIISWSGSRDHSTSRVETEEKRKVLLLYSAGYNNLKGYLNDNIEDLKQGWLPGNHRGDDVVLVYTHASKTAYDYKTPTNPYLIRLYSDSEGSVISDTLVTYPDNTISSSADQLNAVLTYVKDNFHAKSYGMVFSSHATGFTPPGYYLSPSSYKFNENRMRSSVNINAPTEVPREFIERDPSLPMTKSIGGDFHSVNSSTVSYEIELKAFARAIPMEMEYILFDSCLMAGVEIAYELREKCIYIGASQAEVLAWGLNYRTLTTHLLKERESNPQKVCEDFFEQYDSMSGPNRSATISLIDTRDMELLAEVCMPLFEKYRQAIRDLGYYEVQGYGGIKYYFFDLVDIIRCAGATGEELSELERAMEKVIPYKNTTGQYYSDTDDMVHRIDMSRFSGLTMYLPRTNITELDKYYRTLGWNQATELVEY